MPEVPVVRVRHMKSILAKLDGLPPPAASAIRATLDPGSLREIEDGIGVEWLPLEVNLRVTRGVHDVLGPGAAHEFWRSLMLSGFQTPLFKTLVDAAIALFGLDPSSWARWVPRAWTLVFRGCGEWEPSSRGPGEVVLRATGLPGACLADDVWITSVASSLSALLDLARAPGTMDVAAVDRRAGSADLVLHWARR